MASAGPVGVVWFKRDLRVRDHRPLAEAVAECPGGVIGLYVYEPIVLRAPEHDGRHLRFVNDCLLEVREELRRRGSDLLLARGNAVETLESLRRAIGFTRLYSHEETGLGATFDRDKAVGAWARASGTEWIEVPQHGVVRPLAPRDGWARRWRARMLENVAPPPVAVRPPPADDLDRFGRGELLEADRAVPDSIQRGGASRGDALLDSFLHQRGRRYQSDMSSPITAWHGCSRLSPHIAYGSVSVRVASQAADARIDQLAADPASGERSGWRRSIASFSKRLRWHCHFIQKLEDEPAIERRNFSRAFDGMRTEDDSAWDREQARRFAAFERAETGYPFVDACLRCLNETGWINFRMRAMLMSFAGYHLWLHWKRPAIHLAGLFTDFEPGIHYSQCQMQSGVTGINTIRIYSPIKQQADQDPGGVFVRRWIPELEGVPDEHLAQPQSMPALTQQMAGCVVGSRYPEPVVDHAAAYREAKQRVHAWRSSPAARTEAQRVYIKHGSRKRSERPTSKRRPPDDRGGAVERMES
ncbi:MAG: FAD-binding domain-containing protein [Planctomycetota bacterium]